jgi:kynureninase
VTDWTLYRAQFSALNDYCHLISNSLGATPDRARAQAAQYVEDWARRGVRAWGESWWGLSRTVGDRIGALLGAAPDTVSMHPNVTTAEASVLSCFDLEGPRNKVVAVEMEFPSILYLYREWLKGRGRLDIVPCPDGITVPTERLLAAIDETTLLVPISHVLFRSSCIVDARAIIERAHAVGALVVLDVYQSLGTIPVNVSELNVDVAVGGCLKWLCGGPGACFLYVRPDLQAKLAPRFTGWLAHTEPFAFDTGPIRRTDGAYRFMTGTPNIPALYICQAGLDIVAEIGSAAIRARSTELTTRLLDAAGKRGWPTTTPSRPEERAGTVALDLPEARRISTLLNARDILVDYRPHAGIRISPHFYNTPNEVDRVVAEIERLQEEGIPGVEEPAHGSSGGPS